MSVNKIQQIYYIVGELKSLLYLADATKQFNQNLQTILAGNANKENLFM